jgi:IS5 family transposase
LERRLAGWKRWRTWQWHPAGSWLLEQKHDEYRQPCAHGPLPRHATRVNRMKRKLQTKAGRAVYAARKTIVEPVFGQIKQARGFRQFLLRGLAKVQGEWALVCLTHNILKLHRLCSA